ncbi:MAG: hypothetical protein ACP5QA_15130 [Phycisphaerae bacterium]
MDHSVKFSIPERDLGKADIEFTVNANGKKLGELHISRGSLVWFPSGNSYGHKASWEDFDKFMKSMPKAEKR